MSGFQKVVVQTDAESACSQETMGAMSPESSMFNLELWRMEMKRVSWTLWERKPSKVRHGE